MLRKLIIAAIVANFLFILGSLIVPSGMNLNYTAIAGNETVTFHPSANVKERLELNAYLYKLKADGSDIDWLAGNQTSLDFGELVEVVNQTSGEFWYMAGATTYAVVMYPNSSGRPYDIKQIGIELTNGDGYAIPSGAYVMTPDYNEDDMKQGSCPGKLGPPASAVAVSKPNTVYESDADTDGLHHTKAIRAYLAITGPDEYLEISNWSKGHLGELGGGTGVGDKQCYYRFPDIVDKWKPVTKDQPPGTYSGYVTFTLSLT